MDADRSGGGLSGDYKFTTSEDRPFADPHGSRLINAGGIEFASTMEDIEFATLGDILLTCASGKEFANTAKRGSRTRERVVRNSRIAFSVRCPDERLSM